MPPKKEMSVIDHGLAIVELIENAVGNSEPCPLCLQYAGGHQSHCPYLYFYGLKPAKVEAVFDDKAYEYDKASGKFKLGEETKKPE